MERTDEEKKMSYRIVIFIGLTLALFSCKVADKLPPGQKLYGGSTVQLIENDSLSGPKPLQLHTLLEDATRPIPNTMIFGYPYKVGINYFLGEKKKDKGFKEWIRKRFGEDPVFIDPYLLEQNALNLSSILHSYGYFNAEVKTVLRTKKERGIAEYTATLHHRYKIDSVIISPPERNTFSEDFLQYSQNFRLPKYFNLERIKTERLAMSNAMRNMGYYYFKPEYIAVLMDSTLKRKSLVANVRPQSEIPSEAKKRYLINNIYVTIDNATHVFEQSMGNFDFFRGLLLEDEGQNYKERIFLDAIAFRPGVLYNNDLVSLSNTRLLSLNNFRSIQSHFNVVNALDSTLLDVYYNLQTQKKKSLRVEANAISRSSGLAGTQFGLSWQNLNTFKGAEFLRIALNGNFEFQLGGKKASTYNENYRTGAEVSLSFPRFIAPFVKIDPENSRVLPKTQLLFSYENFIKKGLYDLNSMRASWSYSWTRGKGIEHSFRPFNINFVKSSNLSPEFVAEIFFNPQLINILNNQFIISSGYEITIARPSKNRGSFSYRGNLDVAGALLSLFDNMKNNKDNVGKVFGEQYSQFVRLENDFRYRYELSRNATWANRAIIGLGVPYSNSLQVPFVNQFYVGGNNSLRAFRARGVGPGTYHNSGSAIEGFLGNNTGDIKLEFNTELRYKLSNLIGTALFVDAGNVWMYKDPFIYDEGAVFSKNFMKELAVGGGLGLRLDFSFLIFRIDVGVPFRKPWLEEKERWVFDEIQLGKKQWRKENIIWNFAVGLPF